MSSCRQSLQTLREEQSLSRHPNHGEACSSWWHLVPKIIPTCVEYPALLGQVLRSKSAESRHFSKNIQYHSSAIAMASVRAEFVSRGLGFSKYNPTITVHGRMYQEIGALQPASVIIPRYSSVCINDTEHATSNRKNLYSGLRKFCVPN